MELVHQHLWHGMKETCAISLLVSFRYLWLLPLYMVGEKKGKPRPSRLESGMWGIFLGNWETILGSMAKAASRTPVVGKFAELEESKHPDYGGGEEKREGVQLIGGESVDGVPAAESDHS
ncbi:hypothetical protein ACFE04_021605 [Oxalis oulophora]